MFTRLNSMRLLLASATVLALVGLSGSAMAAGSSGVGAVGLASVGTPSTQNFDTLPTAGSSTLDTPLPGWYLSEGGTGAAADGAVVADGGTGTTGTAKSYGSGTTTERALGSLCSGGATPIVFGAQFKNNTGSTIGTLNISYNAEQWRDGNNSAADGYTFEYSTNATSLSTGTWTTVTALNFATAIGGANAAVDPPTVTSKSASITGLAIANTGVFWIRWTDVDNTGTDDGISVDNFSLTPYVDVKLRAFNIE